MSLSARIRGVGLVGPGLAGWALAREALAGRAPYVTGPTVLPAPEALPATERRRAGKCVKLALATGLEAAAAAGLDPASLATVFASSSGDGENCHAICETLASDDRMISPTRFHNSVHNAPAGYWSIATGATASADCIAAFDASFGAGLLEALARLAAEPRDPVMLLAYDAPYPEPLHGARPIPDAFGVALALGAADARSGGPLLRVDLAAMKPTRMELPALEALRAGIPAARALPLLALLASGRGGTVAIAYLDDLALRIEASA
ncbi:MAG TPA: beta-ketoacyl synthase chain length factor [Usitatibacter sp.]|nr:beta-ketoacyl synthase chain length factor [Usitatibacter sp.]